MQKYKKIVIRKIEISDFSEVLFLWQKAGLSLSNKRTEYIDFKHIVKLNHSLCFVLKDGNRIKGSILGTFNGRRAWVYHLAIDPEYQNQGYGTKLLQKVEQQLKKRGAYKVNLGVLLKNIKVIPFYKKNGYSLMTDAIYLTKKI